MRYLVLVITVITFLPTTQTQTTDGNSFFVAFPKSAYDEELSVTITTQQEGIVYVVVQSLREYSIFSHLSSNSPLTLILPDSMEILSKNDYNKGLWIRSFVTSQKILVSVMKKARRSHLTGTYLALPPVAYSGLQEYEYYVTSYYWNHRISSNFSSTVVLVGTHANTSVTITPSQQIEIPQHFMRASYPQTTLNAGDSYTILLQPMETFHMESVYDLTGTKVISNQPVTVLGSHECTDVPVSVGFCDYIIEQFPPTVTWGRFFLLTSLHTRETGERYKIIGMKSSTSVKVKCVQESEPPELGHIVMALNASGESREFELGRDRFCSVVSNKPILLVQYSLGWSLDEIGDPFMIVVPPVDQYKNNYSIKAPVSYHNHLTIMVPLKYFNSSRIFLNGTILSGWSPVYCSDSSTCGYGTRASIPPGTHRVHHADPNAEIMVYMYGFEFHDGYGQIAGMKLKKIADTCHHGDARIDPTASDEVSGAVEVCLDGVWTALCGDEWSSMEASVTCRQLGFSHGTLEHVNATRWPTVASDLRCVRDERRLVDCIHSWDIADCRPAGVRCYPQYSVRVELESTPMLAVHPAESQVTLTCLCTPNATLSGGLSTHITWAKDEILLLHNDTQHTITTRSLKNASGIERYETKLTVHRVKPNNNGTYTCSAVVASDSSQQLLSNRYTNQLNISVAETHYVSELFQLKLFGVGSCNHWLLQYESPLEKATDLSQTISEYLQTACHSCNITPALISGPAFKCFAREASEVTFRARLQTLDQATLNRLVEHLKVWVGQSPSVRVGGVLLMVDHECEVVIDFLSAPECDGDMESSSSTTTEDTPLASSPPPSPHSTTHTTSEATSTTSTISNTPDSHRSPPSEPATPPPIHLTTPAKPLDVEPVTAATASTTDHSNPSHPDDNLSVGRHPVALDGSSTSDTVDTSDHTNALVKFVAIGSGVFVATILILAVACVVIVISCLKTRKSPTVNVVSATSPFQLTTYDDPVTEDMQAKVDLSKDLPPDYLKVSDMKM